MKVVPNRKVRVQLVTMEVIMSSSIDFGTLAVGALIGIGCKEQLKSAARVGANLASSLATTAAAAVNAAAAEVEEQTKSSEAGQQPAGQANGNGGTV